MALNTRKFFIQDFYYYYLLNSLQLKIFPHLTFTEADKMASIL